MNHRNLLSVTKIVWKTVLFDIDRMIYSIVKWRKIFLNHRLIHSFKKKSPRFSSWVSFLNRFLDYSTASTKDKGWNRKTLESFLSIHQSNDVSWSIKTIEFENDEKKFFFHTSIFILSELKFTNDQFRSLSRNIFLRNRTIEPSNDLVRFIFQHRVQNRFVITFNFIIFVFKPHRRLIESSWCHEK